MSIRQLAMGAGAVVATGLAPVAAQATVPAKAICAVQQVVACAPYEPCGRTLPGAVSLPVLLKLDREAGTLVSRRESGDERVSAIGSETGNATMHVLQGVDGEVAWTMHISLEDGGFTMTAAQVDVGFIAFGVCTSSMLD
jgi:hypothetical protein